MTFPLPNLSVLASYADVKLLILNALASTWTALPRIFIVGASITPPVIVALPSDNVPACKVPVKLPFLHLKLPLPKSNRLSRAGYKLPFMFKFVASVFEIFPTT